jgi:hypothetical protein
LKKKQFHWSATAQAAFDQLKQAMTSTPVLALPNFHEPFMVETYASDIGIGAVLMQHKQLSIYEKEFLALIMAVEKWRPYLQHQEFIIRTDHKSLIYLTE